MNYLPLSGHLYFNNVWRPSLKCSTSCKIVHIDVPQPTQIRTTAKFNIVLCHRASFLAHGMVYYLLPQKDVGALYSFAILCSQLLVWRFCHLKKLEEFKGSSQWQYLLKCLVESAYLRVVHVPNYHAHATLNSVKIALSI